MASQVTGPAQPPSAAAAMVGDRAVRILPSVLLYDAPPSDTFASDYEEEWLNVGDAKLVQNVTSPTITPVLPPSGMANGTAVIIAPGGGYYMLSIEEEGMRQARWLAERGFAAFVLKYRTIPIDPATFQDVVFPFLVKMVEPGSDVYALLDFPPAVADGAAAIRVVRSRATEWDVDAGRVVFMGFSAGAFTTLRLATSADPEDRPDYAAPIYPSLEALPVPTDAPPMFGAIALDDQLFQNRGFGLLTAWQKSSRPFEFHLFERGGHGFGTGAPGTTSMNWIESFHAWLASHGLTARGKKPV